ncbi:hypothetical protein D0T90_09415 [Neisseria animalis]|uniref:Uncharacterized protein n=1 Tax=Neisseria animalis TaxID=492 RepID=A0A5P3MUB8_NEIAN|nr:hypothetical protein D0T90_09415 [Neisseria animalis]
MLRPSANEKFHLQTAFSVAQTGRAGRKMVHSLPVKTKSLVWLYRFCRSSFADGLPAFKQ